MIIIIIVPNPSQLKIKMNVKITTFVSPFSFFCITEDSTERNIINQNETEVNYAFSNKANITEFNHGQYVAVMWNNKWARGIVSMETQILIWLIDYGIFIRPNEKNVFIDLPLEFRKLPSKVFEASVQGVVPVDKTWSWATDNIELKNDIARTWNKGSIEAANVLLRSCEKTHFKPIAILTTQHNDVVLGDLFLEIHGKGIVNIIDELQMWPIFLKQSIDLYVQSFPMHYTNRRRHRSCLLKPSLQGFNLPTVTLKTSLEDFTAIVAQSPAIDTLFEIESVFADGSTVVGKPEGADKSTHKITPADIEKYSKRFITLNGREYNVLSILINKARDLNICERYKDHDLKSIGRGTSCRRKDCV